jgi:tellurite resistance protein TerC
MDVPPWMWIAFVAVVLASLVVDLLSHRSGHASSRAAAIAWSAAWIALALGFAGWIGHHLGRDRAEDFLGAYLMEKSLSVDNLFVFLLVFGRLRVTPSDQHRILFWGILGALVFRGVFIVAGASVVARWHEALYVLGVILIYSGWKTARARGAPENQDSKIMRFVRDRLGVRSTFALALITIELTDIVFAVDSIPAVFAISSDPFIVYTSNVFAILGLRALYSVLADVLGRLRYVHYGLAAILGLAGLKMLMSRLYQPPHVVSLLAIATILAIVTIASLSTRRG